MSVIPWRCLRVVRLLFLHEWPPLQSSVSRPSCLRRSERKLTLSKLESVFFLPYTRARESLEQTECEYNRFCIPDVQWCHYAERICHQSLSTVPKGSGFDAQTQQHLLQWFHTVGKDLGFHILFWLWGWQWFALLRIFHNVLRHNRPLIMS